MNLQKHLSIAQKAALAAGKQIMEIYETDFECSIEHKADNSPLTIADKAANTVIIEMLRTQFPAISILSEENTQDESRFANDWCWIVDPLDGTKEFIKKNGEFTVNIALSHKSKPVLGVIYVPVQETLFFAAEGIGAFKQHDNEVARIKVTDKTNNLTLVGSKSHASEQLIALIGEKKNLLADTISAGSSLKGTLVAQGKADVYYRFGYTCEWDTAAMHCIVEQAGGIFAQMDGSEMTYNRKNNLNEKGFYAVNRAENIWV
jgi:3'(2'), 5'-bisphosphate nucleotidase